MKNYLNMLLEKGGKVSWVLRLMLEMEI
jgi:hypothetical protein